MRLSTQRRGILLAAAVFSSLFVPVHFAAGQFKLVHAPTRIHTDQTVNFYISIDSSIRFDGALLEIPEDWTLEHVTLVSESDQVSDVSFRKLETTTSRFQLLPTRRFSDKGQVILRLKTGDLAGPSSFRMIPFQLTTSSFESRMELYDALSLRQDVRVDSERETPGNLVLERRTGDMSPRVVSTMDLSATPTFTVEFWLKTASSNAVLLSTWDGENDSSYPLELVLDGSGHVVFYRGVPGEHRSMRSEAPVADGMWHHISVSHDGEARWSRMYVDGLSSDSLFHQNPLSVQSATELVLGGRRVKPDSRQAKLDSFTGYIDEIRIWTIERDQTAVRGSMRERMGSREGELEVVSFDDGDDRLSSDVDDHILTVPSDLSFYESIRALEVSFDISSVLLTWQSVVPNVTGFGVERSDDGLNYSEIDRMNIRSNYSVDDRNSSFQYRDTAIPGSVAFYRIRQFFSDGMEIVSSAVKIGMGGEDAIESGSILGNFPNPFNPSTTITYLLREAQHIQVSVWDLSGQMIAMLVDARKDQGEHQVQFEAIDLPTGTYFVRMRTTDGVQTRQIILMK